jgi:hypothetical protein
MSDFMATAPRISTAGFELGAGGVTPPSNPNRRGVFLADVVVELGLADQETIDQAQQTAQETERSLERYLLESGILDEDSLSRAIAERNSLDHVDLGEFEVDMDAAQMVARSAAERYRAVPVSFASDGALIVAVQDPFDTLGTSDIEVMTRSAVRPAIATAGGIDALIERLPERPVQRLRVEAPVKEDVADDLSVEPAESANGDGHFHAPPPTETVFEEVELGVEEAGFAVREPQPEETRAEAPPVEEFPVEEPRAEEAQTGEFQPAAPAEPRPEEAQAVESQPAEPEGPQADEFQVEDEPEPAPEVEEQLPVVELEPEIEDESAFEPDAEPEPAQELEFELVHFPEPEPEVVESDPEPDAVVDLKPELLPLQEPSAGAGSDLETELGSLQETARRADELAATVERRISELKGGADERVASLETDLAVAQRRIEELEAQAGGVDTLAEELRATTAKLEEVNRVLEGSIG